MKITYLQLAQQSTNVKYSKCGCELVFVFCFFCVLSFSPHPPERTQMFVTSRLLEMGFSMRHIYWAMEAAGTALWSVSDAKMFASCVFYLKHLSVHCVCSILFEIEV